MENTSAEVVEQYLRSLHASNLRQGVWPDNNAVIDRLLRDSVNLRSAWDELLKVCPRGIYALGLTLEKWQMVINTIVDVAAGWSPDQISESKQAFKDVRVLTADIEKKASELADLLRRRDRLCEANSISKTPMDFHPIYLLEPAAKVSDYASRYSTKRNNFMRYLDGPLTKLTREFDLKYWPTTADVVDAIGELQDGAAFAGDILTEAAMEARQASPRVFMRSLDQAFRDLSDFDIKIRFSHENYAEIVNAACGLDQTETGENVKTYRAGERKRKG